MYSDEIMNIMLLFFMYCILGWVWETCYVSIESVKIVNRGFLNGPYIPIYGFGGATVYLVLQEYGNGKIFSINTISIYMLGMLLATIIEYLTSFIMEKLFDAKWWDYSEDLLNIKGRVCLRATLFWGILAVIFVQFVNPQIMGIIDEITHDNKIFISTLIGTTMAIDTGTTIVSIIGLKERINVLIELGNNGLEETKEKFENIPIEYQKMVQEYKNKMYGIKNPVISRLMKAYPKLEFRSKEKQLEFEKIKMLKNKIKIKKKD